MKSIYILGAGNFAQEVYSEVFLQGNASQFGKFQGYIYLSKLNNPMEQFSFKQFLQIIYRILTFPLMALVVFLVLMLFLYFFL